MLTSTRPLGTKKAYITLTGDSDAMTLASKIGLIWSDLIDIIFLKRQFNLNQFLAIYYYFKMWNYN